MEAPAAEQLISDLYAYALERQPPPKEYEGWVARAQNGMAPEAIVRSFYTSGEYQRKLAVKSIFPMGHFHSPVVNPDEVKEYYEREVATAPTTLAGIRLNRERMREIWLANLDFIKSTPFTDDPTPANRYNYLGGPFPYGDAITLRMMIRHFRPKRIIEIGSGYSSACILDSAEHSALSELRLTCIDPRTTRLRGLLRPGDLEIVTIVEEPIQAVSPTIVDALKAKDILFIDSTHVMKTGSDVHYEMIHLLPRLKRGVIVHFHDVMFPFEYPRKWVFDDNYSWNEAYMLRTFLMYNKDFRIVFWNSLFYRNFADEIGAEFPLFLRNPGGSIWIERV